ncbi:MAG: beta-N-acetylhexosaminidase [Bacteroidota bacterium]
MKKTAYLILLMLGTTFWANAQSEISIIPQPSEVKSQEGSFLLDKDIKLFSSNSFEEERYFFQKELLRFKKTPSVNHHNKEEAKIQFIKSSRSSEHLYQLKISKDRILINAHSREGAFYGAVSLLQMINNAEKTEKGIRLPCIHIKDRPDYQWRGLMLDESRHFFGKEKVKSLLDWMAYYKLNKFHWHLTDEPGWRIEIQQYPKLGLIGGIGDYTNPYTKPSFYSQEDIKDIVTYARERKIEIIPEIDMPGHATAANRAYPEYSGGGSEDRPEWTFHPGKEGTYQYLTNILKEVSTLFPSQMIHLGGDEVNYGNQKWASDSKVKKLMENKKLKNLKEVEDYFMKRMSDSLMSLNNQILAWDEMANSGIPVDSSIIFWWRHDQPDQLEKSLANNHKTVICPRLPLYFDFVQQENDQYGRKWGGRYNTLKDVFDFSIAQLPIKEEDENLILGFQANLWSETLINEQRLEFMLFPRITALAETAWSSESDRDFDEFLKRLKPHLDIYKKAGLYYFNPFNPQEHKEPAVVKK